MTVQSATGKRPASRPRRDDAADAHAESPAEPVTRTPLVLSSTTAARRVPLSTGVCFPRGMVRQPAQVRLLDSDGSSVLVQQQPLAHWPDGSIQWMLLDFVAESLAVGETHWSLAVDETPHPGPSMQSPLVVDASGPALRASSGLVTLELQSGRVQVRRRRGSETHALRFSLRRRDGRTVEPTIDRAEWETAGPVRATLLLEGRFPGCRGLRFLARLSVHARTGLIHASVRLHNPNRAQHRGGLWDLGDAGSFFFKEFALELGGQHGGALLKAEPDAPVVTVDPGRIELYQDSSGGENWCSRNHVNGDGRVPCRFQGYRVESSAGVREGLRAIPTLAAAGSGGCVAVAVPEFWQQFPKALEFTGEGLRVGLFPCKWDDLFELQGGEQKTHSVWLNFSDETGRDETAVAELNWVHAPVRPRLAPEWYARANVFPCFLTPSRHDPERLDGILEATIHGEQSFFAKREVVDEYGWRHYGETWADHEQRYYSGPQPVISHYNNQFDVIYGLLLHWARTGEAAWRELADPLAQHVIDIDIYHTRADRAAYNGGLFWHTDHYRDAGRCTHRTYSSGNQPAGSPYGGGPANEHNYTTGLLYYHCMTGNPDARDAVLSLADWVIAMDDGGQTPLCLLDDGPTGLASKTCEPDYHGPGRGAGNSVNALLDAWQLTGKTTYLHKAEELIRRCVHPDEDIAALDLLNIELRWSYTVFLSALLRYADLKSAAGQLDEMYAYAAITLGRYAHWMAEHERPFFDRADELEFPTETWAAQELRKANVMRLAARYIGDADRREQAIARGHELAERAWADLFRFESRHVTRAVTLVMTEGHRDACLAAADPEPALAPVGEYQFAPRAAFVSQRQRARGRLRSPRELPGIALRLTSPGLWRASLTALLRRLR